MAPGAPAEAETPAPAAARDAWRRFWRAFAAARRRAALARATAWAAFPLAEVALAVAVLAGWGGITWGVASLTVWQVWPISGGLLALSLGGWRFLFRLFRVGLYVASRRPRGRRRGAA